MKRAMAAAAVLALLGGCGGSSSSSTSGVTHAARVAHRAAPGTTTSGTHVAVHRHPRPRPPVPRPPAAGALPQTEQEPTADTPGFHAEMQALWQAIQTGNAQDALPAYFPEAAYVQLKTGLGDPQGDWQGRLWSDFGLDVGAAHALLGAGAAQASLVTVIVAQEFAHWVPSGVCDNGLGYWEVPDSRVVYREGGVERSFGIASMISWRGVWYVVHLGAILRPTVTGVVDDPETGPGQPVASSTC